MALVSRNKIIAAGAIIGLCALSWSVGFFMTPTKVKEVEKIVVQTRVQTKVDTKIVKVTKKDGEVIETTEIKDRSTAKAEAKTERLKVVERKNDDWLVGGGALWGIDGSRAYQGRVGRRILGGLYLEAIGSSDLTFGLGLSFRF
jgi:hypothetical protein